MSVRAPEGVPESRGLNLFEADPGFRGLLELHLEPKLAAHLMPHFERLGAMAGAELDELALAADKNPPQLVGQRIDKHASYRRLEEVAFGEYGLAAMSHRGGVLGWPDPLPPIAKYALTYVYVQAEFGVCCPLSMTDALTRTIRKFADPALVARYLPGLTSQDMDALTQGAMFMTEQRAGSDVGGTETRAVKDGESWKLHGDKWFCSNADAGLALVLARPEGGDGSSIPGTRGLSLFLMPRTLPDGSPNRYTIVRLKEKLGTRDMPSGETKLEGATAYLVGDPGRGFVQMADMINMSRLSNGMRAAGMMRRALTEALFVARNRRAFGKPLIELPLMRRQLVKLMLPTEAARSMVLYTTLELAKADGGDEAARRRVRLLTPLIKFRACRDARKVTGDAMEVRGGVGYTEEWSDPRLVRDAHLGSIWEGTSNIVALDVLRAIRKEASLEALLPELNEKLERAPRLLAARLAASLDKAAEFALETAATGLESHARQAATGLYYAIAAALMTDEGTRLAEKGNGKADTRRHLLAMLAYVHRLAPRDPLRRDTVGIGPTLSSALLPETPVSPQVLEKLLQVV